QLNVQAETSFVAKAVDWPGWLNAVSSFSGYGQVQWLGHAGFYTCKTGMHGVGRAMDMNHVAWPSREIDIFSHAHANPSIAVRRRYLAIDASCRRYFKYVINGWRDSLHRNHIHADDTFAPGFSTGSETDVFFLQGVLVNLNGSAIAIDGAWGPATSAAYNNMKAKLGMGTDIWASSAAYMNFLTTVAVHGLTNTPF